MSEKRLVVDEDYNWIDTKTGYCIEMEDAFELVNQLSDENEQLKNELRKEKSLREYSDSMYGADLIVNIRFSKGEWRADVSVIDDE